MHAGKLKHDRGVIYMQAALVWGLKEVDARAWIEHGIMGRGELRMEPELEANVQSHLRRIEEAGRFVMPEG